MRTIRLSVLVVAAALALTGCTLPGGDTPATSSSPTTRPTASATPTPTITPTPTAAATPDPTYSPLPPAEGEDPAPSGEWTTELVYETCVGAEDSDPSNPIASYGEIGQSRVDQSGPGYWLVVIPVVRAAGPGQQVCFIDGEPDAPNISVATSL